MQPLIMRSQFQPMDRSQQLARGRTASLKQARASVRDDDDSLFSVRDPLLQMPSAIADGQLGHYATGPLMMQPAASREAVGITHPATSDAAARIAEIHDTSSAYPAFSTSINKPSHIIIITGPAMATNGPRHSYASAVRPACDPPAASTLVVMRAAHHPMHASRRPPACAA